MFYRPGGAILLPSVLGVKEQLPRTALQAPTAVTLFLATSVQLEAEEVARAAAHQRTAAMAALAEAQARQALQAAQEQAGRDMQVEILALLMEPQEAEAV